MTLRGRDGGGVAEEWYWTENCPILLHVLRVSKLFGVNLFGYIVIIERFKCK
jgi:hypothetical protein